MDSVPLHSTATPPLLLEVFFHDGIDISKYNVIYSILDKGCMGLTDEKIEK